MTLKNMKIKAFSLIELLIAVAIIAILAAIAVPNFLEAQTRAKVSRTLNDLKVTGTAIEAYTVDYGRPPYDGEPGFTYYGWVNGLKQLTTPTAYITTLFSDPFKPRALGEPTRPGHTHYIDYPGNSKPSFDYSTAYWNNIGVDAEMTRVWRAKFGYSQWKLTSCGPDRFHNFGLTLLYDPTNGTLSGGDIILSQVGFREAAPE